MKIEEAIQQPHFKTPYHKLAVNLLYTGSWLNAIISSWLKPYDLTSQQYNVLRILRGQHPNPVTLQLVRDRMMDKMSNVSRLVEKLRLKGLVDRHTCPTDRRAVDLLITDRGLETLHDLDEKEKVWVSAMQTLLPADAEMLSDLLDRLRD